MLKLRFHLALAGALCIPAAGQTITGVANAADFSPGVAPGSLASLFGTGLAATTASAAAVPVTTTLAGVSVEVNGKPAPLVYVSPTQINFQVPAATAPGAATLLVRTGGRTSNSFSLATAATALGIFQFGANRAVAVNPDGSVNTSTNSAAAGSTVVVYVTGLGATKPAVADGDASPGGPLAVPEGRVTASIGGVLARVLFLGLSPGFVGLAQGNITIPDLPAGTYPLVLSLDGRASQPAQITVTASISGNSAISVSPGSSWISGAGGTGTLQVRAGTRDTAWTAASSVSWIRITSGSNGTGDGAIEYTVSENTDPFDRTGAIVMGTGARFTLTQGGALEPSVGTKVVRSGLALSVFADRFPYGGKIIYVNGIAFPATGGVLISTSDGRMRRFARDEDGQIGDIATTTSVERGGIMARAGNQVYMWTSGIHRLDDNGNLQSRATGVVAGFGGIAGYGGSLFVAADTIFELDLAGRTRNIVLPTNGSPGWRGADVSPDGTLFLTADRERLMVFRISDGQMVYRSPVVADVSLSRTIEACLFGRGAFAGTFLVVNSQGELVQVDQASGRQTLLVTGISRGNIVQDPNGSILIMNFQVIHRLIATNGPLP